MKNMQTDKRGRLSHRRKLMLRTYGVLMLAILLLPLGGYLYHGMLGQAHAQEATKQDTGQWQGDNPRANYWRDVREGKDGDISNENLNGVLIQSAGENWRQLRNGPIITIGALGMLLILVAVGYFHYRKGQSKLKNGRSGKTVERWTYFERVVHWSTATLFILQALTGLSLLYGRIVLIPVLGKDGFAAYADLAKILHNYLGFLFVISVATMVAMWLKNNIFKDIDWQWLKSGGGLFGSAHPSSEKVNGGEKLWFWLIASAGIIVCITGLIMDFPIFGFGRYTMQLSNVIHSILALIWISAAIGHIYIGTLGTEGALEGMTHGHVDEEWAKQHHDLWYKQLSGQAPTDKPAPSVTQSTNTI